MLQGPNRFKDHRLEQISTRCLPSWWREFDQLFLLWTHMIPSIAVIHYCWMPFTFGCFPFYSVILGFLRYHWFPLFALMGTRTNVVSATLVTGPFLILHYFLLLRFPLQKTPADLPVLGCPRGLTFPFWGVLEVWPLVFLLPRLLDSNFSDPHFGSFSLCHFSQVSWFLSARLKDPQPHSLMVLLPGFP